MCWEKEENRFCSLLSWQRLGAPSQAAHESVPGTRQQQRRLGARRHEGNGVGWSRPSLSPTGHRQRLANAWLRLGRSSPQQLGTSGQKRLLEKLPEKPAKWAASGCWDWNKPPASAKSPDAGPVCLPMNNHHGLGSLFLATVPLKLPSYKGLGLMFSASEVQNKPVPRRYIRNA